ncbi:MAG: hypothetical protein EOR48_22945 [Mesorhizobium sp.]|nr:MAG: hypothetical protein EOR48_22945 [Mesorhizobium sp.]TIP43341.1 MAG: hypothetical protein E5X62_19035 [Mesorhizobium sp.]
MHPEAWRPPHGRARHLAADLVAGDAASVDPTPFRLSRASPKGATSTSSCSKMAANMALRALNKWTALVVIACFCRVTSAMVRASLCPCSWPVATAYPRPTDPAVRARSCRRL